MISEKLTELLTIKNFCRPSAYEEKYVRWASINYNPNTLVDFLRTLSTHLESDMCLPGEQERLEELLSIAETLDFDHVRKMLTNDPETMRLCLIEKLGRECALEILIDGKYQKETFEKITNLPIADYKLVIRRAHELVSSIQDMNVHTDTIISGVPGI